MSLLQLGAKKLIYSIELVVLQYLPAGFEQNLIFVFGDIVRYLNSLLEHLFANDETSYP